MGWDSWTLFSLTVIMYDRDAFYSSHELRHSKFERLEDSNEDHEVLGTTHLYEDGRLRCVPMPTPDPKGTHCETHHPHESDR